MSANRVGPFCGARTKPLARQGPQGDAVTRLTGTVARLFLAGVGRKEKVAKCRSLLGDIKFAEPDPPSAEAAPPPTSREPSPDVGGPMGIIETFRRGQKTQTPAPPRKWEA